MRYWWHKFRRMTWTLPVKSSQNINSSCRYTGDKREETKKFSEHWFSENSVNNILSNMRILSGGCVCLGNFHGRQLCKDAQGISHGSLFSTCIFLWCFIILDHRLFQIYDFRRSSSLFTLRKCVAQLNNVPLFGVINLLINSEIGINSRWKTLHSPCARTNIPVSSHFQEPKIKLVWTIVFFLFCVELIELVELGEFN